MSDEEEKKIEFKIDTIKYGDNFFDTSNLEELKSKINDAKGIDRGAFEVFSENALHSIDFYFQESNPNDISRGQLLNSLVKICSDYENAPKKKSKKVAKIVKKLRESLLNPPSEEGKTKDSKTDDTESNDSSD